MQRLKNTFYAIIIILAASTALHSQSEDLHYELLRFHVVPGQEQEFIRTHAKQVEAYRSACDLPWQFYLYSNHTLELLIPVWEGAELGGQTSSIASHYTDSETRNMIASTQNQMLYLHSDLSYMPANQSGEELPGAYYELVTYRVASGQMDEAIEHLQKLVAIAQRMDSPLAFECYSEGLTEEESTFRLVFAAEDPDDLAERRALHESKATGALRHWRKVMPLLAEPVSTVTGHYVYELSNSEEN